MGSLHNEGSECGMPWESLVLMLGYGLGEFQGKRASPAGGRAMTCWERAWSGEGVACGRVLMVVGGVYRVGPYWEGGPVEGKKCIG